MRLFYVVPCGVPHGTTRVAELEGGEWVLPKGCLVMPLAYHIMRDGDLWERPDEFNPRRFICGETGEIRVPEYFMPFQVSFS